MCAGDKTQPKLPGAIATWPAVSMPKSGQIGNGDHNGVQVRESLVVERHGHLPLSESPIPQ